MFAIKYPAGNQAGYFGFYRLIRNSEFPVFIVDDDCPVQKIPVTDDSPDFRFVQIVVVDIFDFIYRTRIENDWPQTYGSLDLVTVQFDPLRSISEQEGIGTALCIDDFRYL